MRFLTAIRALALTTLVVLSPTMAVATTQEQTLFDRLGGQPAIEGVVDQFLANILGDARINQYFVSADLGRLRGLLVDQICSASGGPCVYTGRSMQETHAGLGIAETDFDALVEDLSAALDALSVPAVEKNELLGLLAPMRTDIVQGPGAVPAVPAPALPPPAAVPAAPAPVLPPPAAVPGVPAPAVPAPAGPSAPAPAAVTIQGFAFNPSPAQVAVGATVTWTNRDSVPHTATGSGFDTGRLAPGQSGSATFSAAGRFTYQCGIHGSMQGEVVVQ